VHAEGPAETNPQTPLDQVHGERQSVYIVLKWQLKQLPELTRQPL